MTSTDTSAASGASTFVEARGLTKRYGNGLLAVDGLDLTVRRGEVYGFLGPNGAGKTTTLRMLLGLIRPTSGTAVVVGEAPGAPAGLAEVGALIEAPRLYPYLSGRDNLRVFAQYSGAAKSQVDDALEQVGLADRGGDKVKGYSLGMKQRLGVAVALLKEPALLILDEPTNGLDPRGMSEMRTFVRALGQGDHTVLLSSHLLGEVEQICDRVGVIRKGRLVADGTVAELRGKAGLVVRADPVDRARPIAAEMLGPEAVEVADDGRLRIAASGEVAAELNRRLVEAGIAVSELVVSERSLEDVFLELTGESEPEVVA